MEQNIFVDYYEVLQSDKTATIEELKKNYQRLALSTHPDKINTSDSESFSLIQKAWNVLRESESRKQYDAELSCRKHSDFLLYDTINLFNMDYIPEDKVYTYRCRCGGTYILEEQSTMPLEIVIGCDECSFSVLVNI